MREIEGVVDIVRRISMGKLDEVERSAGTGRSEWFFRSKGLRDDRWSFLFSVFIRLSWEADLLGAMLLLFVIYEGRVQILVSFL